MPSTIRDLTELTAVALDDYILISDTSDVVNRDKRISKLNFSGGSITGGGTLITGGFSLTVPASGTAALRSGAPVAGRVASWSDANAVQDGGFAASDIARLSQAVTFVSQITALNFLSALVSSLANGAVVNVTSPGSGLAIFASTSDATLGGIIAYRNSATTYCTAVTIGTGIAVTTGVLTGANGTAGKLNISADPTGFFIANQTGSTKTLKVMFV